MNYPKVFFFVKANRETGGGHLVRCIILAKALRQRKIESFFLLTDTDTSYLDFLISNALGYEQLPPYHPGLTTVIMNKLSPYPGSLLVVDTDDPTFHSLIFQKEILSSGILLMIITIKPHAPYHAHILLNQNPIAINHNYETKDRTKKLLGPQYFILSEPFRTEIPNREPDKSSLFNLFISFGTADVHNITLIALKACDRIFKKELINKITVVAGLQNPHIESIREFISNTNLDIELHVNPPQIRTLMLDADIAITSTGLTFWELASVKVPSLIIPASEREIESATYLHHNRLCYQISTHDQLSDLDIIAAEVEKGLTGGLAGWIDKERFDKIINPQGIDGVVDEILSTLKG